MQSPYPSTDRRLPPAPKKSSAWIPFLAGLVFGAITLASSWYFLRDSEVIEQLFTPPVRPYAAYVHSLEQSQLAKSAMGRAWIEAGEKAMQDSVEILPPHLESGYFVPYEQRALSYRIAPKRGQLLSAGLKFTSVIDTPQIFFELFELDTSGQSLPELVAFTDSGHFQLHYEVEEDEVYLLRIQPELLARFSYRLQLVLGASLDFPVAGKDTRAIRSFWGDPRDGGRRKHKGVDIFAARGTPVLAAADGRIRSVRNGGLGGKVVWQRDASQKHSLYYAHLDTQLVRNGQEVKIGDTLGLVGNTGNARFTPPHLHFGIYRRRRGAVDPFPFLFQPPQDPPAIVAADSAILCWHRIRRKSPIYLSPSTKSPLIKEIEAGTPVRLLTAMGKWHLIELEQGEKAYISFRDIISINSSLTKETLDQRTSLHDRPLKGIITEEIAAGTEVEILAQTSRSRYIRTANGKQGWLLEQ